MSIYCRANTLLVFLYSIILESSYSLYDRAFADNIGTVLFYAVIVSFCIPFLSSSFRHGEGLTNIDWATISSLDRSFFRVARVFYLVLQKSLGPNVPYPSPGEMPCITVHLCVSRLDILYVSSLLRLCVCVCTSWRCHGRQQPTRVTQANRIGPLERRLATSSSKSVESCQPITRFMA